MIHPMPTLTAPIKCDCQVPDLYEVKWPEATFTECRRCLALQVKFNTSPDSFTRIKRSRQMTVSDGARCVAGAISAIGAIALVIFVGGLP